MSLKPSTPALDPPAHVSAFTTPRCLLACAAILSSMLAVAPLSAAPADTTLAATPPMGWNSWNHFAGKVNDADVRAAADALVSSGLRDAGYIYVNIDDTWQGKRNAAGEIQANEKFPDMKALADYVHSKGLKIGIYSSPGPTTCARYEGSYQHEEQDAKTYAAWGIDYLKYDLCGYRDIMKKQTGDDHSAEASEMMKQAYEKMHKALLAASSATGRPIVYSLCQYGWDDVWKWGPVVGGNLWRTTGDINDTYKRMSEIGFSQGPLAQYAGPGHWNDPDMLEVGNGGMNSDEYRTHMTLWAILAAPLLAGNDLSKMTPDTLAILENKDVVAIDQDPMGKQGEQRRVENNHEVWARQLSHGKAVALFNRGEQPAPVMLHLKDVGLKPGTIAHDVWNDKDVKLTANDAITVPRHGVVLLLVR